MIAKLFRRILRQRVLSAAFAVAGTLIAGGGLWAYFALREVEQVLIIHFNNYARINQIGSLLDLSIIGMWGIVMVGVNFVLALELNEKDWFWGKFLAAATLFMAVLLFIAFAAIVSVNS